MIPNIKNPNTKISVPCNPVLVKVVCTCTVGPALGSFLAPKYFKVRCTAVFRTGILGLRSNIRNIGDQCRQLCIKMEKP